MTSREDFRERVRERNDLLSVVAASGVEIRHRSGRTVMVKCPFHDDKAASLAIYPDQGRWHCYGGSCSSPGDGDVFTWVMHRDRVDFQRALEILARDAGLEMPVFKPENEEQKKARIGVREMLRLAADYYHEALLNEPAAQEHREYLTGRGFGEDTWKRWYAGAAGSKNGLLAYFKQKCVDLQLAIKVGLLGERDGFTYDRFKNRIVVPFIEGENITFMSGRALKSDASAKWLHLDNTEWSHKTPYNYRSSAEDVVVVEGVFDVWAADLLANDGVDAVGLMGLGTNDPMLTKTLKRRKRVWIGTDNDGTVKSSTIETLAVLAGADRARVLEWPAKDPADWLQAGAVAEQFEQLLGHAPLWTQTLVDRIAAAHEDDVPALVSHAVEIALTLDAARQDAMLGSIKKGSRGVVSSMGIKEAVKEAKQRRRENEKQPDADRSDDGKPFYYVLEGELWCGKGDSARCIMRGGAARYVTMVTEDDGEEKDNKLELLLTLVDDREYVVRVPAKESNESGVVVSAMKAVVGPRITIEAKQGPYLVPAIEHLTNRGELIEMTEIMRTGWFQKDNGEWVYVTPGGTVGDLPEGFSVVAAHNVPGMKDFKVLDEGDKAFTEGLKGLLYLLNAFESPVIYPAFAFAVLPPLARFLPLHKFALHLSGETGSLKTATSKVLSSMYGGFVDHPPMMSWRSTMNSIEAMGFWMPDVPVLVDDYKPRDIKLWDIVGLLQRYAEESGRTRLNRDGSMKRRQAMRCWLLSTGEDLPAGESSVLARMVSIRFPRRPQGAAYNNELAQAQKLSKFFPTVTARWIKWLMAKGEKEDFKETLERYHKLVAAKLQGDAADTPNINRISHNIAMLWVAWEAWWSFIADQFEGKDGYREALRRIEEFTEVAYALAVSVAKQVVDEKPTKVFLSAIQSGLDSGRFRLAHKKENPTVQGLVGWYDHEGIYILPAAYREVSKWGREAGEQLGFTDRELYRLLKEEDLLVRVGKKDTTVGIQVGPTGALASKRVLHLKLGVLDTPAPVILPTDSA